MLAALAHLGKHSIRGGIGKSKLRCNVLGVGKVGDYVRERVGLNYSYHTDSGILCGNALRNSSSHVLK